MDTTANLIAIVDLAFKVIKYMNDVREGGKERSELHQEVLTVYDLLWNLKYDFESHHLGEESAWSRPIKPLFKPGGVVDQLKLVLEQIASKLVLPSRSLKGALKKTKWPFDKPEIQRILGRLRGLTDAISIALNRANLQVGVDTNKDVKFLRHAIDSAELETALKWISPLDFRVLQHAAQRRPLSGTGSWFLDNPQVRGWSDCRTKVLWCHGIPGAGKTVLATTLFQKLQEKHARANVAVLIAYCSFDDANTHLSSNIVSSFLRQLVEKRGKMSEAVRKLYTEHTRNGEQSRPSQQRLVEALSKELETFDNTFIVVDGLDELRENKQKVELLETIESLHPLPQLLVTSRPVESIRKWFNESASEGRYRTGADFEEEEYSYYYCDNCDERDEHSEEGSGDDFSKEDEDDNDDDDDNDDVDGDNDSSSDSDGIGKKFEFIEVSSEEQAEPGPAPDSEGKNEDRANAACYHCKACKRDVCVKCYDQYDICFGCNQSKECFIWAWPGTVTITAHLDDLEQYILWRIDNNDNLKFLLENPGAKAYGLADTIVTRVQEESHEMFLLAKFHMNALEQQVTARDLINALNTLPSNINDIYDSVFNRISSQRLASTLEKLLIIVATARKLLSTESLAHAITVNRDDDDIDELALPDVRHLVSMCAGLVIIELAGHVRLAHETIGNYIASTGLKQSKNGHETLAEICLLYLHFSAFASGACGGPERELLIQERQIKYPLLRYAATHWGIHTQLAHGRAASLARTSSFPRADFVGQLAQDLMSKQENVAAAAQFMWLDDIEASSGWDAEEKVHGLHLSAHFGLTKTVSSLLATGVDVDIEDCLQTTPLMYAAQAGHADIVHLLLHSGADPGRICRRGRTALHRACEENHAKVVKEIVSSFKDVAVNAIDGGSSYNLSALMWAVTNENSEIVKHLLTRKDIDINLKRPDYFQFGALHHCVLAGQIEIAKLLLSDVRVAINAVDSSRQTALTLAAEHGYGDMVALLLEKGADTDARDVYDGPALLRAVDENALECVRILVEHGVDYKFKDFHGRNILHGCAINGHGTIMRYLLKNLPDLDPNAQGDAGETPLHDAVGCSAEAVVRVLLEYGARTDIEDIGGKTPLRLAREQDRDRLFDLLRSARLKELEADERPQRDAGFIDELETYLNEAGPEALDAINDLSREILHIAIQYGRQDNLRLLLDKGADIDSRNKWGHTLLHAAIDFGEYEVAELLLDRGCDMNARDLINRTPLLFCTLQDFKPMFSFLLVKRGASFDRSERDALVPTLRYAVECDEFEVVKTLVDAGVPFRIKDRTGQTPYQQAKRAGHERIAQYLYEQARKERTTWTNSDGVATTAIIEATEGLPVAPSDKNGGPVEDETDIVIQTQVKMVTPKENEAQPPEKVLHYGGKKDEEVLDRGFARSWWNGHNEMTKRELCLLGIIILLLSLLLYK